MCLFFIHFFLKLIVVLFCVGEGELWSFVLLFFFSFFWFVWGFFFLVAVVVYFCWAVVISSSNWLVSIGFASR